MTPVQDVDLSTRNGKKMRVVLRSQDGGASISLQELIRDGSVAGLFSEFSSPLFKFQDPQTAFEYGVQAIRVFLTYSNDEITGVGNPSGSELLPISEQTAVLHKLGLRLMAS